MVYSEHIVHFQLWCTTFVTIRLALRINTNQSFNKCALRLVMEIKLYNLYCTSWYNWITVKDCVKHKIIRYRILGLNYIQHKQKKCKWRLQQNVMTMYDKNNTDTDSIINIDHLIYAKYSYDIWLSMAGGSKEE